MATKFPTLSDLEFYQSKQKLPAWAGKLKSRPQSRFTHELIDYVVNSHAGNRPSSGELAAGNLLSIVRSYRCRGLDLKQELNRIAANPECAISPRRRASYARKWAARLNEISK
jgi:hypothetical protein